MARAAIWTLSLFGLLRLSWIETRLVLPATQAQGDVAFAIFGAPSLPVAVSLACSGTDALALCLGVILAYPARWSSRLAGAAGGLAILLVLNTMRIGTLGRAAASPDWFQALHVVVWPAALTIAIAAYVFWWMGRIETRNGGAAVPQPSRRFIALTASFLLLFAIAAPFYLNSAVVLAWAAFIAGMAGAILTAGGVAAQVSGNVLTTPAGIFFVSQECVATPLVPLYLAATCAYSTSGRWLVAGWLAAVPLFTALGVMRLLLVALPEFAGSPTVLVHAFYQLLLGAVVVCIAAAWRHGREAAPRYALAAIAVGVAFIYWLGPLHASVVTYGAAPLVDPQGAIAFLPVFQAGLYLGLALATLSATQWRLGLAGLVVLVVLQPIVLLALHAIAAAGVTAPVSAIRAWAVVAPILIITVIANARAHT